MTLKNRVKRLEKTTKKSDLPAYYRLEDGEEIPEGYLGKVKLYKTISPDDWDHFSPDDEKKIERESAKEKDNV